MEKSQIWQWFPIFIMFFWMMVTPFLFPYNWQLRYAVNMMGMVVSICFMVFTNELLKYKASEFTHYDCICRPSGARLHLFVTTLETVEIPGQPGTYATALTLGEKVTHNYYGTIEKDGQIVITHWGEWEKRMILCKGKALFKEQVIDHSKSGIIVLYEPTETFDMDHLSPIPVFELAEAPGDYMLTSDYPILASSAGGLLQKRVYTDGKEISGAMLLLAYQKLKQENHKLTVSDRELHRQSMKWHHMSVRGEEVLKQVKNELHSVLSSKSDMKQAVVEQVTTALEAHTKIRNALKELKPQNWFTRGLVTLILGVMAISVFLMNPGGLLQWISTTTNQLFVFMIVAVCAFSFFYWQSRKK